MALARSEVTRPLFSKRFGSSKDGFHVTEYFRDGAQKAPAGRISERIKDAAIIYEIIDELYGKSYYMKFLGGLARYKKTVNHGPFVHLDVRGRRARWGD